MNRTKFVWICICSLAALAVSACSESVDGDDCVQGAKACMDNAVKICHNGQWLDLEVCDATKPVCDPVNFVCTTGVPSCTEADNKCENGMLTRCNNGFLYQQICANTNQICGTDALGQPACVFGDAPMTCTPTCVNGVYTGCNADGTAMAPVNCGENQICGTGSDGKAACVDNHVPDVPVTCTPTCVNGVYTGCNADGTAMVPVNCGENLICGTGSDGKAACVDNEEPDVPVTCTPSCANDVYTGCNADGTAMAPVNCADSDQVCIASGCVDCLVNDIQCVVEDGVHNLYTCTDQNTWNEAVPCTDGKICDTSEQNLGCVKTESGLTCPQPNGFSCQTLDGTEWAVVCSSGQVNEEFSEACVDGSHCDEDVQGCVSEPACGNGIVDKGEDCEQGDLNGATCASVLDIYSASGELGCTRGCKFDTSLCKEYCGNNILEDYESFGSKELCDGTDFGGLTCTTYKDDGKTYTGELVCTTECGIDDSGCVEEVVVVPEAYTSIKSIRDNYKNIVSKGVDNKCSIVEAEGAKSVKVKGLVTGVSSKSGNKGTFFIQGNESDNAAISVYCGEGCNISVTDLSELDGKVVIVSGTGVMGLYGCGLQLVHTEAKPLTITVVSDTIKVVPKTIKIADIDAYNDSTPYAGMLLKVEGVVLSDDSKYLTQGSDKIEPSSYIYQHTWIAGAKYSSVTGILHYYTAGYLAPRRAEDVVESVICDGKCENDMFYSCVDGVTSTTGVGKPTTANGSYSCDVKKGWVLSCDSGYTPNTTGDGCVEVSSGGTVYSTDFSFITGSDNSYEKSYTYTGEGYKIDAACRAKMTEGDKDYSIDGQGCILRTDKKPDSMIVVSNISGGINTVSLDAKGWDNGDISVTVNEVVYGPQSVNQNEVKALEFVIQKSDASSFTVKSNKRIAVDNLKWTTM